MIHGNNRYCAGSPYFLNVGRTFDICNDWVCWFCLGNLLCTTELRIASYAGHQIVVLGIRWLCTTGTDPKFCAGTLYCWGYIGFDDLLFYVYKLCTLFPCSKFSHRVFIWQGFLTRQSYWVIGDCDDSPYFMIASDDVEFGGVRFGAAVMNGLLLHCWKFSPHFKPALVVYFCYESAFRYCSCYMLKTFYYYLKAANYGILPVYSFSILAVFMLYSYGDVWNYTGWSLCTPCFQSINEALVQLAILLGLY